MPQIDETEIKIEPIEDFIPAGEVNSEPNDDITNEPKIEVIENDIKEEFIEINQDEFDIVNGSSQSTHTTPTKLHFSMLTDDQERRVVDLHLKGASMKEICEEFNLAEMNEWCFGLKIKKLIKLMDLKHDSTVVSSPTEKAVQQRKTYKGKYINRSLKSGIENR